jgi:hypothetical protein
MEQYICTNEVDGTMVALGRNRDPYLSGKPLTHLAVRNSQSSTLALIRAVRTGNR